LWGEGGKPSEKKFAGHDINVFVDTAGGGEQVKMIPKSNFTLRLRGKYWKKMLPGILG